MYQILVSMPAGELLVGEGDASDSSRLEIDEWRLSVRFDGQLGKLVIQGSRANLGEALASRGYVVGVFDAHITGGATFFADYADGGGRHEYIYRGTVDDGPIAIGIALDTDPTSGQDTSWLTRTG
jgi:hypothetical protein